ncbi:hypothetical protein Lepto7376_3730 [[Leptolyngbya] sp. PCC 7376]|uniref:DUF3854 domain-containing protein n=1 Tax=[Leptolyngbya] sp. PCC 7376 TaxID=111781 RepID=UPI00029F2DBD|nr:DUF3854 domain-containing protein [[Leptolyngbya] sp. PCC 7376]AFY39906.1 hypothetical protein Lepto7376_3730 [[Leptolyngbya] sp. PCC 7376]
MQTIGKTVLQTELDASAISPDLQHNFIPVKGRDEAIPDVDELAWDYLFYLQTYRKNDGGLRKKWLDNYGHIDAGGWWCPTLDIINGERSQWGCFKPNTPRINRDGKLVKYEHPPKEPTQPFFLEITKERYWSIVINNAVQPEVPDQAGIPEESFPFAFWEIVRQVPEIPIIITEGAKKTASLLSADYCAVGVSGIWNGAPKQKAGDGTPLEKKLNPQLEKIATPGREIIFCFDNDDKPKTIASVTKAIQSMATLFEAQGCTVSVMSWRDIYDEKGIDDVHAIHGSDAVDQLVGERLSFDDWQKLMSKPILKTQETTEEENERYHQKLIDAERIMRENDPEAYTEVTSRMEKVEAFTSTPLAPVSQYDPALAPERNDTAETEDLEPALTYQEIALRTIYGKGHYLALHNQLYAFNGTHYEQLIPQTEKLKIKAWAEQYWVKDPKTKRRTLRYLNTRSINAIWDWALLSFGINPERVNPPGLNLTNGVLRISWQGRIPKWQLCKHTYRDFYLYCSKVSYEPDADPSQCNRLLACLDPAPRTALLRQLAAAFDLQTIRKLHSRGIKAAIAKGTGANGKDSIRAAISKIFCNQMTGIGLSEFQTYDKGKKYGLAPLEHSLVNWSSENNMGTPLDRVESLNICVTGEENGLWIEDKHEKARPCTPKGIHIFNTNQLPKLKSGMESLLSRFVVYDFNKTFKHSPNLSRGELKADPRFHDDPQFLIQEVCPALINRLLEELINLANDGIDYDSIKGGLDELQEESTHLWAFVNDVGLEVAPEGKIWVSELWERLRKWYIDTGALEVEEFENGKTKNTWFEQANPYDRNVKGMNQIYKRFKMLFPKIKRVRETADPIAKGRCYILGITFNTSNPLPHNSDKSGVIASPTAPPILTLPHSSIEKGEGENEGSGKATSLAKTSSEAVSHTSHKLVNFFSQPENLPEIPEKYARASFKFALGEIVQQKSSRRYVEIVEYPGIGFRFSNRTYRCRWLESLSSDPEPTEWINQSDLREID